ncbi:MAG: hypothetical protein SFZ02_11315 [bacterium]|nr:hypothetical protein [bacterium]
MKIRLFFSLLLLLITVPSIAQNQVPSIATVHVFNTATNDILIGAEGDIRQLAPNATTTLYLPTNTPLYINDGAIPLGDDYLVGHRYAFAYLGMGDYTVTDITDTPSDETTSVWWVGNFLADTTASMSVAVNDKPIIENLPHGEWASFVAPIAYFSIAFSVGDVVLYQTDQAFGEPYYTALIGFSGDYTGNLMRDFFPMPIDVIETDFLTWLNALTEANIPPYLYENMLRLIANSEMEYDFLAPDRVILLPYDEAFNELAFDTRMYFFNDDARLTDLLNHHLLVKSEMPQDPSAPITTLAGTELAVGMSSRGLMIANANYITRLLLPNGSEVWLMNGVMLPRVEE